jgi:hypothetical protein
VKENIVRQFINGSDSPTEAGKDVNLQFGQIGETLQ